MKHPALLAAAVLAAFPLIRPASAGEGILRSFDAVRRTESGVNGAPGFGLGLDYKVTELIGIDTRLAYSRHHFRLDLSGENAWTPWVEEDGALDSGQTETAPIIGEGAGHVTLGLLTVSLSFRPIKRDKLELYFGPLLGVSYSESEFDSGRFSAAFRNFNLADSAPLARRVTPLDRRESDQQAEFVYGATIGADVPFGDRGWLVSTSATYLETEMEIDPWTVQLGMGYRF